MRDGLFVSSLENGFEVLANTAGAYQLVRPLNFAFEPAILDGRPRTRRKHVEIQLPQIRKRIARLKRAFSSPEREGSANPERWRPGPT